MLNRVDSGTATRIYIEKTDEGPVCKIADPKTWEWDEFRLDQRGVLLATGTYQTRELARNVVEAFPYYLQHAQDVQEAILNASRNAYSQHEAK